MPIYLAQWEWKTEAAANGQPETSMWRAPGAPDWGLDLRGTDACARPGGAIPATAFGLFGYATPQPGLALRLPDNPGDLLTLTQKSGIKTLVGLPLAYTVPDRLGAALYDILTSQADPDGAGFTAPFMCIPGKPLTIRLGGVQFGRTTFGVNDPAFTLTLDRWRRQYEKRRVAEGLTDSLRHYTGYYERKWGLTADLFLPPARVSDGSLPPRTTIGDTFVEGSDTSLDAHTPTGGAGFTAWGEVAQNWLVVAATDRASTTTATGDGLAMARAGGAGADGDLSSDDHYSQVTKETGSDFRGGGAIVRFDSSANSSYYYRRRVQNGDSHGIYKMVTGTPTLLASVGSDYPDPADGYLLKLTVNGSDLEALEAGVSKVTVSDATFTGQVRCGIHVDNALSNGGFSLDNFEAADIGGAAATSLLMGHPSASTRAVLARF